MAMPTFRVTEKKLEEIIGEPYKGYFKAIRSARFRIVLGVLIWGGVPSLLTGFLLLKSRWLVLIGILSLVMIIPFHFLLKSQFRREISQKMPEVINDPELRWVNGQLPEETVGRWHRIAAGAPVNLRILRYLKQKGNSQSIYKEIKSMKNSNSAYITLKRLSERKNFDTPLIVKENKEFRYVPWKFKVIDKKNHALNTPQAKKIETLLEKCWERWLEDG